MTSAGLLGVWGKWMKHAKYIYNIQDFNPEQVLAVGYTKSKLITDAMMWFDKFSCKRSDLVITVGRDLVETVENRFKDGKKDGIAYIFCSSNSLYKKDDRQDFVSKVVNKDKFEWENITQDIDNICTFCATALFLELCVYYKTLVGKLHPRTC